MDLIIFILLYFIGKMIALKTTLGQYKWFGRLQIYFIMKYPEKMILINRIFDFKGFHCKNCHIFWIVYILSLLLSLHNNLFFAITIYLLVVIEDKK